VDLSRLVIGPTAAGGVRLAGVSGRPAPSHYHVTIIYQAGHSTSVELLIPIDDTTPRKAVWLRDRFLAHLGGMAKAAKAIEGQIIVAERPWAVANGDSECRLASAVRLRASDADRSVVEQFPQNVFSLLRHVPFEVVPADRVWPRIDPVFERWPTTVPQNSVEACAVVRSAERWANE
jgi:hypothetical protein